MKRSTDYAETQRTRYLTTNRTTGTITVRITTKAARPDSNDTDTSQDSQP